MTDLLYKDFLWLQIPLATTFFGIITILWGSFTKRQNLIRWGLVAFLFTGLSGIPIYYHGMDVIHAMQQTGLTKEVVNEFQMDYYTTLIVTFFLSITALMSLIMHRAVHYVPKLFLYPVVLYGIMVAGYLAWRSYHLFN